jgi:predicted RNA-binding Zn-ribbon protein involved in translation (DUF1610 family)
VHRRVFRLMSVLSLVTAVAVAYWTHSYVRWVALLTTRSGLWIELRASPTRETLLVTRTTGWRWRTQIRICTAASMPCEFASPSWTRGGAEKLGIGWSVGKCSLALRQDGTPMTLKQYRDLSLSSPTPWEPMTTPVNYVQWRARSSLIECVTLVLPSVWIIVSARRWMVRRRRRGLGLCVACGYDLRGSARICPECGSAVVVSRTQRPAGVTNRRNPESP